MAEIVEIDSEKSFNKELKTDKNNSYSLSLTLNESIEIVAEQINNIIPKSFSSIYSIEEIGINKYFSKFKSLNAIFDEIKDRIYNNNNNIIIKENENNLMINIPLPKKQEFIFELKLNKKIKNEKIIEIIYKLNNEIISLKNEVSLLKNDNTNLKNEVKDLKEKYTSLIEEKMYISNLDSKIINNNKKYNESLKNWINPSKKIKAELLYRLSENGDNKSTFHKLCDNKGPTLTLFHVNDGNIVGIYTPLSWDETSGWKNDMDTFIFNLNKNQKYKKLKNHSSIFCDSTCGPDTNYFGCDSSNSMKSITYWANYINNYYDKGSEILPSNNQEKVYDLIETEVYGIIIE